MIALLIAGAFSMLYSLLLTPVFIRIFNRLRWGQPIRVDGPKEHEVKRGTPTMGGIIFLSGSVLDGRPVQAGAEYLGRYHRQISVLLEGDGRSLFGWLTPGRDRFSVTRLFASTLARNKRFAFLTAVWGGRLSSVTRRRMVNAAGGSPSTPGCGSG